MEMAVLFITHLSLMGIGFALGRLKGHNEAQPKRDKRGRFAKRES